MVQRGYWSSQKRTVCQPGKETTRKISRGTNVLLFRDAGTIGPRKLDGYPYSVKREHQAGLCSEGVRPAGQVSGSP